MIDARELENGQIVRSDVALNTRRLLMAEVLFMILPFVVTGIVFSYQGVLLKLIYLPEWSLASSVLMGQALVKYISAILSSQNRTELPWQRVALNLSFLIVLGLVPSLLILSLVLIAEPYSYSNRLAVSQIVLFIFGLISFFIFGGYTPGLAGKRVSKATQAEPSEK